MNSEIDPRIRPIAYGMVGMLYELIGFMRKAYGEDLESALIMICVSDATMQKYMPGARPDSEIMHKMELAESVRGSISRRMIADKTGLPRETVRRKVAQLIAKNQLYIDAEGAVRATPRLHDPELRQAVIDAHEAVKRYMRVVGSFNVN
ncbi:MAG: hypothetical protein JNM47_01525 [Hyphomonadaceae bacterium]|nr:hypothetical protein [Hyphomonadaceae bacterium]